MTRFRPARRADISVARLNFSSLLMLLLLLLLVRVRAATALVRSTTHSVLMLLNLAIVEPPQITALDEDCLLALAVEACQTRHARTGCWRGAAGWLAPPLSMLSRSTCMCSLKGQHYYQFCCRQMAQSNLGVKNTMATCHHKKGMVERRPMKQHVKKKSKKVREKNH